MNKPLRTTALCSAMALHATVSAVAGQAPRRITLDEAIELFAQNNLELRIARTDAAEASALAGQAAAHPNPTLAGTHEPLSGDGRSYSESYLNVSQRLEWPGTRSARQEAAALSAAAAQARLVADSARLAFEVKRTYLEAALAHRSETVLMRVTEVFRQGDRSAEERYREGDISLYDRRRIRVERNRYETLLAEATIDAAAARRRLALLITPEGDLHEWAPADWPPGSPPAVDEAAALALALERRHEFAAAQSALLAAQASVRAARGERIPDITATAGYKNQSDGLGGAFLGLSLPLPLWDRRGGAIEAAEARSLAAASRLALVRRQVETDARRALHAYRSVSARAALLEPSATQETDDLLAIARVAWDEGEMELIELLDAAEALRDAQLAEARLRADLWTRYFDVERAVGGFGGATNGRDDR